MEKYLELLPTSNSLASTMSIIQSALSDPDVYHGFDVLAARATPKISSSQSSSSNDNNNTNASSTLLVLELFARGTYKDYISYLSEGRITGELTDRQLRKLRSLTVVSIVREIIEGDNDKKYALPNRNRTQKIKKCWIVPYSVIRKELGLFSSTSCSSISPDLNDEKKEDEHSWRDVEEILIGCIYSGLLPDGCKLDQRSFSLVIRPSSSIRSLNFNNDGEGDNISRTAYDRVLTRDVGMDLQGLSNMINKLETLVKKGESMKNFLETQAGPPSTRSKSDENNGTGAGYAGVVANGAMARATLAEANKWVKVDAAIEEVSKAVAKPSFSSTGGNASVDTAAASGNFNFARRQTKRNRG